VAALAAGRQLIGVDLQSHGRTPAVDRPMRFETMADDVAALLGHLGHEQADVVGYSLGGGVALRTAIQHPALVRRLVLVSNPFLRSGWHAERIAAFDEMGPHVAGPFKQTPMYEAYRAIAPRADDWPVLGAQLTELLKLDYDWSAEVRGLPMPVLIVVGDADGLPPRHAVELFELLGGDQRDAVRDRSGMSRHGLAVLARLTHYEFQV
jgi:pimeloyl-ACP methyl ester carboxylesterase